MNLQENIRKVLREEVNKQILTKIVRRLDNFDKLIFQSAGWISQYYKERFLKEKGLDWFIETVIDGFYIDEISPIFEDWDGEDGQLEPVMSISDDEEEELKTFFKDKYYDKIEEYYENIFGNNIDESIIKEDEIKSLFRPITKLIEYFLSKDNIEKYVCDYKLEPGNFATKNTGEKYQKFKVTLYFKNLPKKNISWNSFTNPNFVGEKIMNELQDLILNAVGVYVDMYGSTSKNCKNIDESILRKETELPEFITEMFDDGEEPKLVKKHSTKETITYDYSLPSKKSEGTYIIRMTLYKKYLNLDLKNVMELEFYYSKDGVSDIGYTGLNEILYLFTSINKLIEKHKKEFKYLMVASTKDRLSLYKKAVSRISYLTLVDTSDRYILYSNSQYSRWF